MHAVRHEQTAGVIRVLVAGFCDAGVLLIWTGNSEQGCWFSLDKAGYCHIRAAAHTLQAHKAPE